MIIPNDIRNVALLSSAMTDGQLTTLIDVTVELLKQLKLTNPSDELLAYVAAHFALLAQGGEMISFRILDNAQAFSRLVGQGFRQTAQGQMALILDPTGLLIEADSILLRKNTPTKLVYVGTNLDRT